MVVVMTVVALMVAMVSVMGCDGSCVDHNVA